MFNPVKFANFLKSPLIKRSLFIFVSLLGGSLLLLFLKWSQLPPEVPLYYSLPWGAKQLALRHQLLVLPALATVIFVGNLVIAFALFSKNSLLLRILLLSGLFVAVLLFYSLFRIIFLVS